MSATATTTTTTTMSDHPQINSYNPSSTSISLLPNDSTIKLIQQEDSDYFTITGEDESCFSDCCTIIDSQSLSENSSYTDTSPLNESLSSSSSLSSLESEFREAITSKDDNYKSRRSRNSSSKSNETAANRYNGSSKFKKATNKHKSDPQIDNHSNSNLLARLINSQYHSNLSNSTDSLSTFILDNNNSNSNSINSPSPALSQSGSNNTFQNKSLNIDIGRPHYEEHEIPNSAPSSPTSAEPSKILKSSLKLNTMRKSLPRSNSMPAFPTKKSVKFPSTGLEDVCFFNKHDTPSSVSAVPSSDEDDEERKEGEESVTSEDEFSSSLLKDGYQQEFSFGYPPKKSKANFFLLDYDSGQEDIVSKQNGGAGNNKKMKSYWKIASSNIDEMILSTNHHNNTIYSGSRVVELGSHIRLESIFLSTGANGANKKSTKYLMGNILVKNLSFEKHVTVKLTTNNWSSFKQFTANYLESVTDGIDRFQFKLNLDKLNVNSNSSNTKLTIKFCLGYQVSNTKYWDNNNNLNYDLKLTKHWSRKSHRKQVSESNISMLNELLANTHLERPVSKPTGRYFSDEDNVEFWFSRSRPTDLQRRYSFDAENDENNSLGYNTDQSVSTITQDPTDTYQNENFSTSFSPKLNMKSYNELLANYCFYEGGDQLN